MSSKTIPIDKLIEILRQSYYVLSEEAEEICTVSFNDETNPTVITLKSYEFPDNPIVFNTADNLECETTDYTVKIIDSDGDDWNLILLVGHRFN